MISPSEPGDPSASAGMGTPPEIDSEEVRRTPAVVRHRVRGLVCRNHIQGGTERRDVQYFVIELGVQIGCRSRYRRIDPAFIVLNDVEVIGLVGVDRGVSRQRGVPDAVTRPRRAFLVDRAPAPQAGSPCCPSPSYTAELESSWSWSWSVAPSSSSLSWAAQWSSWSYLYWSWWLLMARLPRRLPGICGRARVRGTSAGMSTA